MQEINVTLTVPFPRPFIDYQPSSPTFLAITLFHFIYTVSSYMEVWYFKVWPTNCLPPHFALEPQPYSNGY